MVRTRLVYAAFAFAFILIIIRLFYWQIVAGNRLKAEAVTQYSQSLILPAARGEILASDGSSLVINRPAFLAYAKPAEISDKNMFVDKISEYLQVNKTELLPSLDVPGRYWVPVIKKVPAEIKSQLDSLKLSGLGFEKESVRYYPEASMAAQLLGFVGQTTEGEEKGYFGLEGFYDRQLRGKDGSVSLERDPTGTRILLDDDVRIEPENGRTLELWVDKTIQLIAEQHLRSGINKYGAKEGSVVIMDPQTGGILAMASFPRYDPAQYYEYNDDFFRNPIVGSSYEPGSTFKVLIMAKGLDLKLVQPDTVLKEDGPVNISNYLIRTWNDQYRGSITATETLTFSSNVGMVAVGEKIGKDRLLDVIHQLGFGELTGIDLQDEETPQLRAANQWTEIDWATSTFGQGIAVTPIQMVRAVSTIANGGWLMEPKVVKRIIDERGNVTDIAPKKIRQVFQKTTTKVLTEMMVTAVENGEAKWAKPKGYRIAGKTGTAQIPVLGHYDDKKTIASFVGFAPPENPKFVILVTLREPTSSPWGSETAAPLFFAIAKDMFIYLGLPPQ